MSASFERAFVAAVAPHQCADPCFPRNTELPVGDNPVIAGLRRPISTRTSRVINLVSEEFN
jgi:hypothetical protein